MKVRNRQDQEKHEVSHTKEGQAAGIESSRPSASSSGSASSAGTQSPSHQRDRVARPGTEGTLIQNVSTHAQRTDGIRPQVGAGSASMRLQGGPSGYPRSVQKALDAKPPRSGGPSRGRSSSPEPSSVSESSRSGNSSRERSPSDGPSHGQSIESEANEMKKFLASGIRQPPPAGVLDGEKIRESVQQNFHGEALSRLLVSKNSLNLHGLVPGQDFVAPGTRIFTRTGWTTEESLQREALKHPELYSPAVLEKVSVLGKSKTDNQLRAYIYRNDHLTKDSSQSRRRGDVLMIDEAQGLLGAFSRNGRIKTARIDSPEVLRNYIQDEKYKDLERG